MTYDRAMHLLLNAGLEWEEAHQIASSVAEEESANVAA